MRYIYENSAENDIKGKDFRWVVLALNRKKWWTFAVVLKFLILLMNTHISNYKLISCDHKENLSIIQLSDLCFSE
jgi:hypothetical protein